MKRLKSTANPMRDDVLSPAFRRNLSIYKRSRLKAGLKTSRRFKNFNAAASLLLSAFLLISTACWSVPETENANVENANAVAPAANGNVNTDAPKTENNAVTGQPKNESNSAPPDAETARKLEQSILGVWTGTGPSGDKIGLDFRAGNKVFAVGEGASKEPAKYEFVDENTVRLTVPDDAEGITLDVQGDKMTMSGEFGKVEFTKAK